MNRKAIISALSFVVSSSLVLAPCAQAFSGADKADKDELSGAVAYISSLYSSNDGSSMFASSCTGTLVSPEWVLTASHCFMNISDSSRNESKVTFGTTRAGKRYTVTDVHQNPTTDMALIKLNSPVEDVKPVTLWDSHPQSFGDSATGRVYGWADKQGERIIVSPHLTTTTGTLFNRVIRGHLANVSEDFSVKEVLSYPMYYSKGLVVNGDSGGPVFIDGKQFGVVSGSVEEDGVALGEMGMYISVSDHAGWVNSTVGENIISMSHDSSVTEETVDEEKDVAVPAPQVVDEVEISDPEEATPISDSTPISAGEVNDEPVSNEENVTNREGKPHVSSFPTLLQSNSSDTPSRTTSSTLQQSASPVSTTASSVAPSHNATEKSLAPHSREKGKSAVNTEDSSSSFTVHKGHAVGPQVNTGGEVSSASFLSKILAIFSSVQ